MSRLLLALTVSLGTLTSAAFAGDFKVPRPAPEFVINLPGGKQDLLSRYKGKVVALSFIFTTCPHCQKECQMLSKLQKELGAQGFQPIAVAVNPMAIMLVPDFVREFGVTFPVGASEKNPALDFMHINEVTDRWVVPQLAIIDRKGQIRVQTPYNGDEKLQTEANVRSIIEGLLKEGATPAKRAAAAAAPKK